MAISGTPGTQRLRGRIHFPIPLCGAFAKPGYQKWDDHFAHCFHFGNVIYGDNVFKLYVDLFVHNPTPPPN
jgi:hypothetical protein